MNKTYVVWDILHPVGIILFFLAVISVVVAQVIIFQSFNIPNMIIGHIITINVTLIFLGYFLSRSIRQKKDVKQLQSLSEREIEVREMIDYLLQLDDEKFMKTRIVMKSFSD